MHPRGTGEAPFGCKNTLWKLQEIYFGVVIAKREEFVSAVVTDEKLAKLLKTTPGVAVLKIEVKLSCMNGEVAEYRLTLAHLGLLKYYTMSSTTTGPVSFP